MQAEHFPGPPVDLSSFAGEMTFGGPAIESAADDFGHLVRRTPLAVARPNTVRDVVSAVQWASERGVPIAARGQGHSIYGQAQAEGGLVVDMSALNSTHDVSADRVIVDGGATWQSVLAATLPHGLTPPVLTNYLDLSVGGTLSVGGIGGTTHRHGFQTDNVFELEVVTGDGRQLTCSPRERADLFNAVRAGLGQFGIIVRATVRLMPAPERVRRYTLAYPDLVSLTTDQRKVLKESRADHLQGTVRAGDTGWRYLLEMVTFDSNGDLPADGEVLAGLDDDRDLAQVDDPNYLQHVQAFDALARLLRTTGDWWNPHPWLLTFLPGSAAERIAADILASLVAEDLGEYGQVTFYPITTRQISTPFLRLPAEDVVFPFNLIRIPSSDAVAAERLVDQNRVLYDRVRAAGGMLYPVSGFPLTPDDWREHFGDRWAALASAKRRYDPRHTMTPGQGMFPFADGHRDDDAWRT